MNVDIRQRMREVLQAEANALLSVRVTPPFETAVSVLLDCSGKVVTTGMGKAGLVARKFAGTLCSTGTAAVYLHPGDALHGDLGFIAEGDTLVAFSVSGLTREVLDVLKLSRRLTPATNIGITSRAESPLRDLCDVIVDFGPIHEPCPLGLTPTASITVMQAIGDALALATMEVRGCSAADFGLRHHAGYLGIRSRRLSAVAAQPGNITEEARGDTRFQHGPSPIHNVGEK